MKKKEADGVNPVTLSGRRKGGRDSVGGQGTWFHFSVEVSGYSCF